MPRIHARYYHHGTPEYHHRFVGVVEETPDDDDDPKLEQPQGSYGQAWENMYERLVIYKNHHGDCMVPRSYKSDPKLGRWVNKQRSQQSKMPKERRDKLERIGFIWKVQKHEEWHTMYQKLVAYKTQHGNCLVPQKYKTDPKLGKWVDNQRTFQKAGQLLRERKTLLDEIGFVWKVTETWDDMFQKLVAYKEEFGHCLVPQSYPRLGNWVRLQRVRKKTRTPEQKRKLRSIGFVWNARKESWRNVY